MCRLSVALITVRRRGNKTDYYIANAKTKRNWLIRGHVALDKCNVSLGKQVKNCCPATNIKKNKMAAELASFETRIFKSCVEIK